MILFILQDGVTPFQVACQEGHLDVTQTLTFDRANVNHTDKIYHDIIVHVPLPSSMCRSNSNKSSVAFSLTWEWGDLKALMWP